VSHSPVLRFCILLVCALTPLSHGASPPGAKLRLATYNLGNYNATGRMTSEGYLRNYPKAEESKLALRRVIRALGADLLALQEIGSQAHLEELRRDLLAEGTEYAHAQVPEGAPDTERRLGILSRLPLEKVKLHSDPLVRIDGLETPLKRGILEVSLRLPQGLLTLWILHLKSRIPAEGDSLSSRRRAAEAVALRDLVLRQHPDPRSQLFALLGDFNDSRGSRPLRAVQDKGSTPIAELLEAEDSRGERWTHYNARDDSYERLDHILFSKGLFATLRSKPRARIVDAPGTLTASDHRPVFVDLCFTGEEPTRSAAQP